MAGALDGIRVVDFGQYVAGPLLGMLLADQGADVIRVDPPGGPRWDTPANRTWNRGKRSIVLDLKQAEDAAVARALVASADVVVENFRPGVMDRLGLGAGAMTAAQPDLVYCSLPGFAADDPRAAIPAWEGVLGAATRTYPLHPRDGTPVYTAIPVSSCYAAFQGAVAIAMALTARARGSGGQRIEIPLFDATFGAIGYRGLRVHQQPPAAPAGAVMRWTRQFECRDGRWVQFHAGNGNFGAFVDAAGAGTWAGGEDVEAQIIALFKSRTAKEWEDFAEQVGTECAVCRTSAEWLDNEHARGSRIVVESDDPVLGRLTQPGINVRLSATPGELRAPAPLPDQHRTAVLTEAATEDASRSASDATIGASGGNGHGHEREVLHAALQGMKVLDLCIVLAGPTCGRTLAEFGADVVKIDSPYRPGVAFHNDINRGKRSILLDLTSEEGLRVFWRLVEDADVVVQNFRKGVADRLGIGYEQVRSRRPDIVYASLNTYGQVGPWSGRPGHEQIAQAASGMQTRFGGTGRPVLQNFAINDYGTGFMGAYGVALALLHRQRTGEGQHVDTALAYTATILQSPFLQDYAGKQWDEPAGQDATGSSPLHRAYQTKDGWLFLGLRRADIGRLEQATGLSGLATQTDAGIERALTTWISTGTVAAWEERLRTAGIGAHRVVEQIEELMADPWVRSRGLSITRDHDGFGPIDTTGPAFRLSSTPTVPGRPASRPGADAAAILSEIGLGGDFERLVRDRIVITEGVVAR